jgi:hypothetical protein
MTATDLRRSGPRQTGMKSLAGGLAFVCLVLFLLAIEQKHAVAAWTTLREEAVPAARRVADWTGQMASGEAGGLGGLKSALADDDNPRTAGATDTVLAGEFGPADAQIELRRILPATRGEPVRASALCGGEAPALIALLHRRDRVDLMLFRAPARPGPDAPVASFCGAWRLKAR